MLFCIVEGFSPKKKSNNHFKRKMSPILKGKTSESHIIGVPMDVCTRAYTHNIGLHSTRAEDRLTTDLSLNLSSPKDCSTSSFHAFQWCSPPEGSARWFSERILEFRETFKAVALGAPPRKSARRTCSGTHR